MGRKETTEPLIGIGRGGLDSRSSFKSKVAKNGV